MYDLTIPRRIKQRREAQGLAGYQLAKMAGISPSYYSLIENGQKLPSADVAVRLAEALGDDPELYRAWVETGDQDEQQLTARVERLEKMQRFISTPQSRLHRRGRSRMAADDASLRRRDVVAASREPGTAKSGIKGVFSEPESAAVFDEMALGFEPLPEMRGPDQAGAEQRTHPVPLLAEGTDPAEALVELDGSEETIAVDTSLLPDDRRGLFAYRVSERSLERVRSLVLPGDVLVFSADPEGVDPLAIYAVRYRGRIVLARITYAEPTLLLRSSDHYQEPLTVSIGDEERMLEALAGVVVTGIRTWSMPQRAGRRPRKAALGRSGLLDDDGNIVRDCEWKENYGWRPVQRPEDMDYLDDNPGAKVRFRLLRDGRVKHVLEMDPDQWREALGSYYEGATWRRNGYIVAITRRVKGEYTEEFQERWAAYVCKAGSRDR